METKKNTEVEITQYLRPNGRKQTVFADVGQEYVKKARGMILSAEVLTTGELALYGRWASEDEEMENTEIAKNEPGNNDPTEKLKKIIDKVLLREL